MSISDKVRKELWSKSGNKCALCHTDLFRDGENGSYNIGEECHIISEKPNGPRHKDGIDDYDTYNNLILLCKNHHRAIDDPVNLTKYSIGYLIDKKSEHEKWVSQRLLEKNSNILSLIKNGNELVSILGVGIVRTFNDNPNSIEEAEYIGNIIDDITDFISIMSELAPSDITKKEYTYTQMIGEMATKCFFMYGGIIKESYLKHLGDRNLYNIAIIYIKKQTTTPKL